jgi:hypothetical protein
MIMYDMPWHDFEKFLQEKKLLFLFFNRMNNRKAVWLKISYKSFSFVYPRKILIQNVNILSHGFSPLIHFAAANFLILIVSERSLILFLTYTHKSCLMCSTQKMLFASSFLELNTLWNVWILKGYAVGAKESLSWKSDEFFIVTTHSQKNERNIDTHTQTHTHLRQNLTISHRLVHSPFPFFAFRLNFF